MNHGLPHSLVASLLLVLATAAPAHAAPRHLQGAPPAGEPGVIELAICLDTSGSMTGLIDAARQKLWAIVNDLALAEPTPRLRVALLTFGTPEYGAESGFVKLRTPLTEDLDLVSKELFALATRGGEEYVARVLQHAVAHLKWSAAERALKVIIVAGNEAANQDPLVDFRDSCRQAIERGILVNSIYCGPESDDLAPLWREVAVLADGRFASIDQDHGLVAIETPFDEALAALSGEVNDTYIPFGAQGQWAAANQVLQDRNAAGENSAAAASRAQTKASKLYRCAWDLVDAVDQGQVELAEVKNEDLPERLRGLAPDELARAVADAGARRAEIQLRIQQVSLERLEFVQAEMARQGADDGQAFDRAIREAIRAQAVSKGFRFADPEPAPAEPAAAPADG
ncbi:MAG: VWA domain-containing protein [Planctomycetes bacterium]|nr:VWA domain-containing protein [Planctomycetota bacterium]